MRLATFTDPSPDKLPNSDLNPYVKQYWESGFPVVRGIDAPQYKGKWHTCFNDRKAPLHLEIGSGNGFFLAGMAHKRPAENWLGLEIRYKRVILCAKKIVAAQVPNARILRYDAWFLHELFEQAELSGLYTNHPDPWKKKKQSKHRLLNERFVSWAASALKTGARWRIKTDFKTHIEAVLQAVTNAPFEVVGQSEDTKSGVPWNPEDDITTNYESKFHLQDLPVYGLELERV